ncbi:alkaline shock response membrane anchor protein AmaP [Epidermidibacterium keratini]|uniref:Alkaline shock response membrane anchor protein AmaP n=1 Tax=Epidermidibacterium keratini TaxID=1891644 RepID=A0A7L4YM05_9ACTN|nr:alkaline shock response membrane anchor protein AmaP [Epidermidibacterium keratini]QHB99858.1 alkaline shock response membrane anchor protein AmaP [Epidermidibacterium keratini]
MHADRTNRTVNILLALILLGGGVAVALLSFGVFGQQSADRKVTDNVVSQFVGDQGTWFWPVAAVVALLVLLLCLRWIIAILASTDRVGELIVGGDRSHGRTVLSTGAVTDALVTEVEGYRGVSSASARTIGNEAHPEIVLQTRLDSSADIGDVRTKIDSEAAAHVREAMDDPQLPITVELSMDNDAGSRVR